jgi:2-C-methyl-D-erythritol 4-phosphate cytidylyltransferase
MPAASAAWVLLAAGSSTRFGGGRSKLLETLGSSRVIDVTLASMEAALPGAPVLLVSGAEFRDVLGLGVAWTEGGRLRQDSARNGLAALPPGVEIALIHDAARPFPSPALVARLLEAMRNWDAACPGVAVTDTIKRVEPSGRVVETLTRSTLRAVQTPQAVRVPAAGKAFAAIPPGVEFTDDLQVMEAAGFKTAVVDGDPHNLKITTPSDLSTAERILKDIHPSSFIPHPS